MRWFTLITAFMLICFISLVIFIWTWRTELASRCFDLSLQNAQTKVESVSALSLHSIALNNIQISQKNNESISDPLQIDQILLEIRTTELLAWMLLPLRNPLIIENATIILQNSDIELKSSSSSPLLFIRKVEAILANGQRISLGEQKGTAGSILANVLQTIKSEKPLNQGVTTN